MKERKPREAETVQAPPLKVVGPSDEVVEAILADRNVPCFQCGKPAVGVTSFVIGSKDGVPREERDESVCDDCYTVLKMKTRTKSRLSD